MEEIQYLLNEIQEIKKCETIIVCETCKKTCVKLCPRCIYIANKFKTVKEKQIEEYAVRLRAWVHKVKIFLQSILEKGEKYLCKTNVTTMEELEKLLTYLKSPVVFREIEIDIFPPLQKLTSLQDFEETHELLEGILSEMKSKDKYNAFANFGDNLRFFSPISNLHVNSISSLQANMILRKDMRLLPKKDDYLTTKRHKENTRVKVTKMDRSKTLESKRKMESSKKKPKKVEAAQSKKKDSKRQNEAIEMVKKGQSDVSMKKDGENEKEEMLPADLLDFIQQIKLEHTDLTKKDSAKSEHFEKETQTDLDKMSPISTASILDPKAAAEESLVEDCEIGRTSENVMIKGTKLVPFYPHYQNVVTLKEKANFHVKDDGLIEKNADDPTYKAPSSKRTRALDKVKISLHNNVNIVISTILHV